MKTRRQVRAKELKYGNCIDVLGWPATILRIRPVLFCGLPAYELLLNSNPTLGYLRFFPDAWVSVENL